MANLIAATVVASNQTQVSAADREALHKITPSAIVLSFRGVPCGSAACIDSRGYFVAHRSSVPSHRMSGKLYSGRTIELVMTSTDEPTQLVLLEAQEWTEGMAVPAIVTNGDEIAGKTLLAIVPAGAIRAKFVSGDRLGILTGSRRMVPLSEVRFEDRGVPVGGALIFSYDGHFMGALNATLAAEGQLATQAQNRASSPFALVNPIASMMSQRQVGPGQLTVGYTIAPEELHRVVSGFRSASKEVVHPAVGLFCKDAIGGGALIAQVQGDSPAEQAKLKAGDVIVEIAGQPVHNQFDFAKVLLRHQVGERITFKIVRSGAPVSVDLIVGKQSN